jgi:minor extracellular serine protease Vpr
LAYRVSDNGESVSSDLIIKAIQQAVIDQADIINISLGVNKTNKKIDDAVNNAINNGIVVVAAAGNNGPGLGTIGSPGRNPNTITVGASYNNISSSLVSTLEVDHIQFQVIPMIGTKALEEPIISEIQFGKFGRERDLDNINVENSILLVERGSDVEDEIVYFSDKESNAAMAGAKAIIVYNNRPGLFLGELNHEFSGPDYLPTIPALSMSNEDGMKLRSLLQNKTIGTVNVFYNPDFVAHFSSRGPVSPFYIKPDMVAPGAFVNTTLADGKYNFTSGTSFAAPHVAGAAALLIEKNPDLKPNEIKSLLVTTSDPVADAYGTIFPSEIGGTGRINVTKAFEAGLVIEPTFLVFNLSPEIPTKTDYLQFRSLQESHEVINTSFRGNDVVNFTTKLEKNRLAVTSSLNEIRYGEYEDRVLINHDGVSYNIPVLIHVNKGGIKVHENQGELNFDILFPEKWSYAKISIINGKTGNTDTTSATPKNAALLKVYEPGEYWVESKIRYNDETFNAYEKFEVKYITQTQSLNLFNLLDIPERPIIIVFFVIITIALVGLKIRK